MVATNGAEQQDSISLLAATAFSNLKNNCASVLNLSITSTDTTVNLVAGSGATFPVAPFYCSCEYEVMYCTGKSGDNLTVTRGQDGTTAAAHTAGTIIEQRNNAALWNDLALAINKIENGTTLLPPNIADGSIGNVKLAQDVPRPSLLQNGSFDNWHLGNGPFTVMGYAADNWSIALTAADTMSVIRDSANADDAGYCAAITVVISGGTDTRFYTSSQFGNLGIPIELVRGKQVTFTARVKCSVANAVRLSINSYYSSASHYTYSTYHTGGGTYQTLSVTATFNNSADTIAQVALNFTLSCTAYLDAATLVYGAASVLYTPAQIPDVITNQRLASDVARANLLVNGGFEINQRGSGPWAANGTYTSDRWIIEGGFSTIVLTGATVDVDLGSQYALYVDHPAGAVANVTQRVELFQARGRQFSASVRVKTAYPNGVTLILTSDGTSPLTASSSPHSGNGQYQTLSCTLSNVPMDAAYLYFRIGFANATFQAYLDNAMLVAGNVPTDYIPLHPADDLARCERYYEKIGDVAQSIAFFGYGTASAALQTPITHKTRKGGNPTATVGTFGLSNATSPTIVTSGPDSFYLGTVAVAAGMAQYYNTSNPAVRLEFNP